MNNNITVDNLLQTFPNSMKNDPMVLALATAISELLTSRRTEIDNLNIYANIDVLPEELLDLLAYDFKVDWWDGNCDIDQKRAILKKSWFVHRRLGTKAAVEEAVSAVFPDSTVTEWFEYAGQPFHFRVTIMLASQSTADAYSTAVKIIEIYKNVRSVLDAIDYASESDLEIYSGVSSAVCIYEDGATVAQ